MCWSVTMCKRGGWIIIAQDRLPTCSNIHDEVRKNTFWVLSCISRRWNSSRHFIVALPASHVSFSRIYERNSLRVWEGLSVFWDAITKIVHSFSLFCLVVLIDSKIKIHYFFQTFCFPDIMIDDSFYQFRPY